MEEVKLTKREKVKVHFKKHKGKYVTGGVVAIGCVGFYAGYKYRASLTKLADENISTSQSCSMGDINVGESAVIENSIVGNCNTIIVRGRRGHAGNVVKRLSDGKEWDSQNLLAEELGVNSGTVSKAIRDGNSLYGENYVVKATYNSETPIEMDIA